MQTMSLAVNISSCRAHKLPPSTGKTEAPNTVQNFYSAEKDHVVCQVSKIGSIYISIIKHTMTQTEVACLAHGPFCHFINSTSRICLIPGGKQKPQLVPVFYEATVCRILKAQSVNLML